MNYNPGWYPYGDGTLRWWDGQNWIVPPHKPFRGLAITSLVLAIVGCIFGMIPILGYFAIIIGAIGLIFGVLGFKNTIGKFGTVISILAVTLGIIGLVIVAHAVDHASNCINSIQVQDDGSVTTDPGC